MSENIKVLGIISIEFIIFSSLLFCYFRSLAPFWLAYPHIISITRSSISSIFFPFQLALFVIYQLIFSFARSISADWPPDL